MNKKFKLFAILSVALVLSLCLVFAACNTTPDNKQEVNKDAEVVNNNGKVVSSLTFEDKEEFDVKSDVLHLYEKDFEKKGSQIIVDDVANLSVGQVVLLDYEAAQDQSYRITGYNTYGDKFALDVEVNDDVYGVYDQIDVSKSVALTDDGATIEFIDDAELIAQFMETDLAFGIEGLFGKPAVSIPTKEIDKENGFAHIALRISFPIYNANGVSSDVAIILDNKIYVDSDCNFNLVPLKFDLGANMTVITDTTFQVDLGYGIDGQENAEDVAAKLLSLLGYDPSEFNLTIFTWSYPVGPLLISYDLDVKFSVKFEGQFNMTATSQVECYLGASYDSETATADDEKAFDVVFEKGENNYFKLSSAELYGTLKTSAGIVNTIHLDILAVAGVGLKLDLGLYADLYGAVEFNVTDIKESNGGYYFEPGFYYSVDLLAGLNVANLIKLNKNFNLANGRIAFPHLIAGEKTFVVAFNNVPETVDVTSNCYVLPTFETKLYNLINRGFEYNTIDYTAIDVTLDSTSNFAYADGVLTVKDGAADAFEEIVTISLKDVPQINKQVKFVKVSNVPYALNSVANYTKGSAEGVEFVLDLKGEEFVDVTGNDVVYDFADNVVTIDAIYLSTLANDRYEFVINTTDHTINVYVNVFGIVSLTSNGDGTEVSPYLIYSADQLAELSATAARNNYFNGKYFKLVYDIDFLGKEFAPISNFAGTFDGNGKTVKNFVINTTVDGYTGLFAKNSGTVKNLTIEAAKVEINEQIVYAGAVAGENRGTIENVTSYADVIVSFKTKTSVHNKFYVGGIVGYNYGTVANVTANGKVSALTSGITSSSNVIYVAGVIGFNEGTATEGIASNANVEFDDSWYKLNKVTHNDTINN